MKDYLAFSIDRAACRSQLTSFATLLESKSALSERNDILNFFQNSVFVNRKRSAPYWSPRFEQGYNQVVDWFWKLQDMSSTQEFVLRFGAGYIKYEGMLIVGRDHFLDIRAQQRLDWRQDKVLVDSKRIHILTYDDYCVSSSISWIPTSRARRQHRRQRRADSKGISV